MYRWSCVGEHVSAGHVCGCTNEQQRTVLDVIPQVSPTLCS